MIITTAVLLVRAGHRRRKPRGYLDSGKVRREDEPVGKPLTFDNQTTAEELRSLPSCRLLTVEALSQVNPAACRGLSTSCLSDFNVTNLPLACLMNISWETIQSISAKTFRELIQSGPEQLFFALEDLEVLLVEYGTDVERFPETFVAYCGADPSFTEVYLSALNRINHHQGILQMFSGPRLAKLDPSFFRHLTPETVKAMPSMTFSQMSPAQLGRMSPEAFGGFQPAQIEATPAGNFKSLTAEHIYFLPVPCLQAISPAQARSLGPEPADLPQVISQAKEARDEESLLRRLFLHRHPCKAAHDRFRHFLDQLVKDALQQRCDPIWNPSFTTSSSHLGLGQSSNQQTTPVKVEAKRAKIKIDRDHASSRQSQTLLPTLLIPVCLLFLF